MTLRRLLVVATVLASVVALVATVLLASVAVLFSAAAAQANPCGPGTGTVLDTGGPVRIPVTGAYTVTSEYGNRRHPVTGEARMHAGIDLAMTPHGGPVVAMKAGQVTATPTDPLAGQMVVVDHGGGLQSRYLHLATRSVRDGQRVAAGQRIGTEGATGRVTGPHLHWEVHRSGRPVDPRTWAAAEELALPPAGGRGRAAGPAPAGSSPRSEPTPGPSSSAGGIPSARLTARLPAQVGPYRGEQIRNAALVVRAGRSMRLDDWTVAVGVMTAMGESSLRNLDRGDAVGPDSRGLFQQRDNGAWGSYTERMDPTAAATHFFEALLRVSGYRDLAPTIAAHRTQHNADPYHYAPHWPQAVQMVAVLTGDPALLRSLTDDGGTVACDPALLAAGSPEAPGAVCPPSGNPAETGLQPGATRTLRCATAAFPWIGTVHGVARRSGPSDHETGDAVDFMVDGYRTPEGRARGWQVAEWTRAHASRLGVTYVIFDAKIWSVERASQGWRPYTRYGITADDTLAHRDHVHVSTRSSPGG